MATNEDLYREMVDQERRDDKVYGQDYTMKAAKITPKGPDPDKGRERFKNEIAPVLEARRRLSAGLPATTNPLVNLYLKVMGKDKLEELPETEIVDRAKSFGLIGPSVEDIQKMIAQDPDKFRDLSRSAPEVRPVQVRRKTTEDVIGEAEARHEGTV